MNRSPISIGCGLPSASGQTAEFASDFQTWQTATQQFRQTNLDINWVFLGARQVLKKDRIGDSSKQLLAAMMDALEDRSRPLPPWPGPGAH